MSITNNLSIFIIGGFPKKGSKLLKPPVGKQNLYTESGLIIFVMDCRRPQCPKRTYHYIEQKKAFFINWKEKTIEVSYSKKTAKKKNHAFGSRGILLLHPASCATFSR